MSPHGNVCTVCGQTHDPKALFCPNDGAPLGNSERSTPTDPYLGLEIVGQIRLERLIGMGSMGRVYRAFQAGVDRLVAVKVLHRELSANEALVLRFHREAKVASRICHPNVVQVLMTGQLLTAGVAEGSMYIVMEHLDGVSLRSSLAAAGGALPLARALHVLLQVCDAVGEAHTLGVVHRDLKPDNVMLVRRGNDPDFVKVLDFGIARLTESDLPSVTQAGVVFGSARYISPEGAAGKPVGPPADVYAIATVLYQALSGRTPFDGDSSVALLVQHMNEPPPPITSIPRAAHVPAPIAELIMRNLDKRPERRAADARTFGVSLMEAARASGLLAEDLLPRSALFQAEDKNVTSRFASMDEASSLDLSASHEGTDHGTSRSQADGTPPDIDPTRKDLTALAPLSGTPLPSEGMRLDVSGETSRLGVLAWSAGCFLVGAALAALGAYRWGLLSQPESAEAGLAPSAQNTAAAPSSAPPSSAPPSSAPPSSAPPSSAPPSSAPPSLAPSPGADGAGVDDAAALGTRPR